MSLLNIALAYANRGWPVFPLEVHGKQPLGRLVPHGLKDATIDEATIAGWWADEPDANIGLPTGLAFDVADFDSQAAMDVFVHDCHEHHVDPSSFPRTKTGGGGRHVLVAPTGQGNRAKVLPDMDWRGKGGYIVAPGSIHESGQLYEWVKEPNGSFPPCPDWLLVAEVVAEPPRPISTDVPPAAYIKKAVEEELDKVGAGPEGQRNDLLNRASFALGSMVGAGWLSRSSAEFDLRQAAIRCGLADPEISRTINSGLNSGIKKPRPLPVSKVKAEVRKAVAAIVEITELLSASDLLTLDIPNLEWSVNDLLPEGLGLLISKPKGGKSWLMLQLGLAVAGGTPFFGHPVVQGEVLYLAFEDGRRRLKDRLQKVLRGAAPPPGLTIVTVEDKWGRADAGGHDRILRWLEDHPRARLVLVDTLGRFRTMEDGRRNAYMADLAALEPLQAEALQRHLAIVAAHHDNKSLANEDWVYSISGTQAVAGTADTLWGLARRQGSDLALFKSHGRDIGENCLILRFDGWSKKRNLLALPSFSWRLVGRALPGATLSVEREAVIRMLDDAKGPMSLTDIALRFADESYDAVRVRVNRMIDAGLLEDVKGGVSLLQVFGLFGTSDPPEIKPSSEQTEQTEQTEHLEPTEHIEHTHTYIERENSKEGSGETQG